MITDRILSLYATAGLALGLLVLIVSLIVLYWVIKLAVLAALRKHTSEQLTVTTPPRDFLAPQQYTAHDQQ